MPIPGYPQRPRLAYFMEQFRTLPGVGRWKRAVAGEGDAAAWLEQGKKIAVKNAPTYFGTVAYEIVSDADHGKITATVEIPLAGRPSGAAAHCAIRRPCRSKASP